jgi:hypothetical protein
MADPMWMIRRSSSHQSISYHLIRGHETKGVRAAGQPIASTRVGH